MCGSFCFLWFMYAWLNIGEGSIVDLPEVIIMQSLSSTKSLQSPNLVLISRMTDSGLEKVSLQI